MKIMGVKSFVAGIALAASLPALPHHSFAAFDLKSTVSIDGTLTEVKFANPHSWFEVEVKGPDGKSVLWGVEGLSAAQFVKKGLKRTQMKPGDHVEVVLNPMRSGDPGGSLVSLKLADGSIVKGGPGQ